VYTVVLRDTSEANKEAQTRENLLVATTRATEARAKLIGGVTHDVKNPLGASDGFAALLEMDLRGSLLAGQAQLGGGPPQYSGRSGTDLGRRVADASLRSDPP